MPAAGLLLGIGGALSNKATVQAYPILNNEALQGLFQIMSAAGSVVFANLALLLCIGLGIGLAKRDKGVAAPCCGCRLSHYDGYHCRINSDFLS